jgi:hypothetical protein
VPMVPYRTEYGVIYAVDPGRSQAPTFVPPRDAGQGNSKRKIGQHLKRCTEHRACFAASPFRALPTSRLGSLEESECGFLEGMRSGVPILPTKPSPLWLKQRCNGTAAPSL